MGIPTMEISVFGNTDIPNLSVHNLQQSKIIEFTNTRRKIQASCSLDQSQKGCITFSGIDLATGQLLYITEWMIKYSYLETICAANCKPSNSAGSCSEHGVEEVIANIENQMIQLAQLRHNNIVHYECVRCEKKTNGILVHLAQDFVYGTRIGNLSTSFGWSEQYASIVTKSVLDALIFLHNNHVTHGLLCDMVVYYDNLSNIRVSDFTLVPYLQDLIGVRRLIKNDVEALGTLVKSLSPTSSLVMRNFINKCMSQNELITLVDLLNDPFLQPELPNDEEKANKFEITLPNSIESESRFQSDYKNLTYLGEGGFGDVFKGKNNLDNREYAIKRIRLPAKSQKLYDTMTREVKVLSRLNHENVVRYYTSWIETVPIGKDDNKLESDEWSSNTDSAELANSPNDENEDYNLISAETKQENPILQYMYIQMEYCGGSTLRTIIDDDLYVDEERQWRLFREIVEGLAHIHQKNIIHRDLKPANIFIATQDRIKIGDFGLATTCRQDSGNKEQPRLKPSFEIVTSLTGNIGTALYSAPELLDSKSKYNKKVDLYSLGVILFEMSYPPFKTVMERVSVLNGLRTVAIKLPEIFLNQSNCEQNISLIRRLLDHNSNNRPTSEELKNMEFKPVLTTNINATTLHPCNSIPQCRLC